MNIVNVGYQSTNYYILADTKPRLLIDVGWPGTLPFLQSQIKRAGTTLPGHLLITHYHPDHAGIAQEVKQAGAKLIVLETQRTAIPVLKSYMKPEHPYQEIDLSDAITLATQDSRAFLAALGIQGQIISTPGHSDDSVTLVLDEGIAFIGDLRFPMEGEEDELAASWERLRALKVHTIYPGHGPVRPFKQI